jgi:hypothetical protein
MIVNFNNKGEVFSKNLINNQYEDFTCVISYEYDDKKYHFNGFDVKVLPNNVMPDGLSIKKVDAFHNDNGNITLLPPMFTISGTYTKLPEIPDDTMVSFELTFNHEKIDETKISSIFSQIAKKFGINADFNLFSYFNIDSKNYETEFIVSKDILINWEYIKPEITVESPLKFEGQERDDQGIYREYVPEIGPKEYYSDTSLFTYTYKSSDRPHGLDIDIEDGKLIISSEYWHWWEGTITFPITVKYPGADDKELIIEIITHPDLEHCALCDDKLVEGRYIYCSHCLGNVCDVHGIETCSVCGETICRTVLR